MKLEILPIEGMPERHLRQGINRKSDPGPFKTPLLYLTDYTNAGKVTQPTPKPADTNGHL